MDTTGHPYWRVAAACDFDEDGVIRPSATSYRVDFLAIQKCRGNLLKAYKNASTLTFFYVFDTKWHPTHGKPFLAPDTIRYQHKNTLWNYLDRKFPVGYGAPISDAELSEVEECLSDTSDGSKKRD